MLDLFGPLIFYDLCIVRPLFELSHAGGSNIKLAVRLFKSFIQELCVKNYSKFRANGKWYIQANTDIISLSALTIIESEIAGMAHSLTINDAFFSTFITNIVQVKGRI